MAGTEFERDAWISRLPKDAPASERSGTLILDPLGYLSVEISFLGDAVQGLDVNFYTADDDGDKANLVSDPNNPGTVRIYTTDDTGRAHLDFLVPIGNYICEIPYQADAVVTTVEDIDKPFLLALPIGRACFDLQRTLQQGDFTAPAPPSDAPHSPPVQPGILP